MLEPCLADPRAPAITHEQGSITYGELARGIDAAAAQLWHGWGVRNGDRVAWLGAADPAQIILLFALARIGAILLPLNSRLAPPEWDAQVVQCTPRLLLHDAAFAKAASELAQRHGIASHAAGELAQEEWPRAPDHAHADRPVL